MTGGDLEERKRRERRSWAMGVLGLVVAVGASLAYQHWPGGTGWECYEYREAGDRERQICFPGEDRCELALEKHRLTSAESDDISDCSEARNLWCGDSGLREGGCFSSLARCELYFGGGACFPHTERAKLVSDSE